MPSKRFDRPLKVFFPGVLKGNLFYVSSSAQINFYNFPFNLEAERTDLIQITVKVCLHIT